KFRLFLLFLIFVFSLYNVFSYTNISSCADDIVSSGTYHMNQSFGDVSNCLLINANDVYLDCKGYVVYNSSIQGIYTSTTRDNITLVNCNLNGAGIGFSSVSTSNITILNSTIFNATNNGVYMVCHDCLFENLNISYCGGGGVYVSTGSNIIINNVSSHFNVQGLILSDTSGTNVSNFYAYNNSLRGLGMGFQVSNNTFTNLDLRFNNDGIKFWMVNGNNTFKNSIIKDNLVYNINFGDNSTKNTFYNNSLGNFSKIYSNNWTKNTPNDWNYSGFGNTYDIGSGSYVCFDPSNNLNCDYFPSFLQSNLTVGVVSSGSKFPVSSFFSLSLSILVLGLGFFLS
ncbi:MAG: right-handed parallel beta-helix repeat-containing protein, partial [Nanoarchaeota archaeon]|nr:right-handed parallel beta-helix repeat-containing protein [Nanoarchaeota archaeon]